MQVVRSWPPSASTPQVLAMRADRVRGAARRRTASGTGTVNQMSVYLDASSSATRVVLGLYADGGNRPGALLTQGVVAAPVAGAWNSAAVPPVQVTSGGLYWLALMAPTGMGTVQFRDRCSGCGGLTETAAEAPDGTMPSTWTTIPSGRWRSRCG